MEGYKKSKLGWIPVDWEVVRLQEHINLLSGFAFKSDLFNEDGKGIKLLRGVNISKGFLRWNEKIDKYWSEEFKELKKYLLEEGDLVISMDGSLVGRNFARVSEKFLPLLLVQRVARIRAKKTLDLNYLHHIIGSILFLKYVDAVKTSSGIPHISSKQIKNFTICYPPLKEQKKIAHILSTIDSKIQNISDQITATQDLKKGLMQQLLTEGIGHTVFKDSKLGRIPESWEVVRFGELISKYGYGPRFSSKDYHEDGNVKTIRGTDIGLNGEILYHQVPSAKLPNELIKNHKLRHLDLVMITTADCGLTGVYEKQDVYFIPSAYAVKFSLNEKGDAYYFKYLLQTKLAKNQVQKFIRKGTVANLAGSDILKFKFPLPPLKEQKQIAKILTQVDKKIANLEAQQTAQEELKRGLMQVLLTGAVRVRN